MLDIKSREEFFRSLSTYTLFFRNPKHEKVYAERRADPNRMTCSMKALAAVFLVAYTVRRLELLLCPSPNHYTEGSTDKTKETVTISFWAAVLILEFVLATLFRVEKLRGAFLTLYFTCSIHFSSGEYPSTKSNISPLCITSHVFIVLVGFVYARTWLAPFFAITIGMLGSIVGHVEASYAPLDFAMISLFVILDYLLMVTFFYLAELNERYSVFTELEKQKGYSSTIKLLKKLPDPLFIFSEGARPVFWNTSAERLSQSRNVDADEIKNVLERVRDTRGPQTAMQIVEHSEAENAGESQGKYTIEVNDQLMTYTLKTAKGKFQGRNSVVLMLQDETGYERVVKLEEKCQKMHMATIVHDMRTPLNGVMGILELALDTASIPAELREHLKLAKNTCMQLFFLTLDITDFSQIEAGRLRISRREFSLAEVVRDCIQLLAFPFEKKHIKISASIHMNTPERISSDKNRYTQVLLNYLSNALKFTLNGEVSIIVEYNPCTDLVLTTVRDTGVGIKPEDLPKLFKMFGKLDDLGTGVNLIGVGFGLCICKKLAEAMGGYVGVTSTYGVGSSFVFAVRANLATPAQEEAKESLPSFGDDQERISSDAQVNVTEHQFVPRNSSKSTSPGLRLQMCKNGSTDKLLKPEEPKEMPRSKFYASKEDVREPKSPVPTCACPKILHVDDNECNKMVLQNYLKLKGMSADEAGNGQEAVEKIKARAKSTCCGKYQLVLMDIEMPVLNGIEATTEITRLVKAGTVPATKVFVLSVLFLYG